MTRILTIIAITQIVHPLYTGSLPTSKPNIFLTVFIIQATQLSPHSKFGCSICCSNARPLLAARAPLARAVPKRSATTSTAVKTGSLGDAGREMPAIVQTAPPQEAALEPSLSHNSHAHGFNWHRCWYPIIPLDYLQKDRPQVT